MNDQRYILLPLEIFIFMINKNVLKGFVIIFNILKSLTIVETNTYIRIKL